MEKINNTKIIGELRTSGIAKVPNFFNRNEIDLAKSILYFYSKSKAQPKTIFPVSYKNFFVKALKLEFKKIFDSIKLTNIAKEKDLETISELFFNNKSKLNMIDSYLSKKTKSNIFDWHCDQPFYESNNRINQHDNRELKFFIYLSKVYTDNGCMSYIPGSHKFVYEFKKLTFENKLPYIKFKYLREFNDWLKNNENYNKLKENFKNKETLDEFIQKTNFINNSNDTNQYDYEMNEGDAIIFDENGFHRGTKLLYSDRLVLRYHFSRKTKLK